MPRKKVLYNCIKCGYKTNRRSNYLKHLKKKYPCDLTEIKDIKIKEINNDNLNLECILRQYKLDNNNLKLEMEKYKINALNFKLKNEELNNQLEEERKSKNKSIEELIYN